MGFLMWRFSLFLMVLLVSQVVEVVLVSQVFHDLEHCWWIEVGWV